MARARVTLGKDLSDSIAGGHPWIYDRAVLSAPDAAAGTLVDVVRDARVLACGYLDPGSPIRVRLLGGAGQRYGEDWVREQARASARARHGDPALVGCDAWRLIHGENDGMPGLVVDLYGDTAVVMTDGPGPTAFWTPHLSAVLDALRDAGSAIDRAWFRPRGGKAESILGDRPAPELVVREDEIRFAVDVVSGQKTGLFLDQRDNRRRAAALAPGATVLNLFSYTGGFSVAAALAGAARTTSVDIAGPAIDAARRSFAHSGIDPGDHELVVADVFDFARGAREQGRRWDVVICDPPSFAPSARSRGRALAAYRRLAALCLELTDPGGVVVFASCSSHVGDDDLLAALGSASTELRRALRVRAVHGAATDHPVRPGFPEGRYLNAIFAVRV